MIELSPDAEPLLTGVGPPDRAGAGAGATCPHVAPDNAELGVMLPYTPLHHLLFAAGAPDVLVMTSANRSSEPIAYEDDDALERLAGMADAFLVGERPDRAAGRGFGRPRRRRSGPRSSGAPAATRPAPSRRCRSTARCWRSAPT